MARNGNLAENDKTSLGERGWPLRISRLWNTIMYAESG
jgi:hypothetical protein